MKIVLDEGAYMPERAHIFDAGLDLRARETKTISARGSAMFDTGVHIEIPAGHAGVLIAKSGLNTKHGITSTGLIDAGYTGSIVAKLYNHSDKDYTVQAGDKITQLVLIAIALPLEFDIVDSLEETDRGSKGFGSTGR